MTFLLGRIYDISIGDWQHLHADLWIIIYIRKSAYVSVWSVLIIKYLWLGLGTSVYMIPIFDLTFAVWGGEAPTLIIIYAFVFCLEY